MILDKKNNIIKFLFGISLSFILIYYSTKDFNLNKLKEVFSNVNQSFILFSSVLMVFTVYLRAVRWKILLNKNCSINFLYKSQLIGYFGNNVLPLRLGELLKSYFVGAQYNLSKTEIFGTVVLERVLDMFATAFFIFIIFFLNKSFFLSLHSELYYGLGFICIIGIVGLALSYKKINFLETDYKLLLFLKGIYVGFSFLNKNNIIKVLFFTFLIWFIYLLQVYLMQKAFLLNLSMYQSLLLLVISTAVISIPALPGNFGTFEGSVVYSLALFNIVDDFGFSIILHLISFIPFTILGAIYFIQNFKLFRRSFFYING